MTDDELLEQLRVKRAIPAGRIDMNTLPVPRLYDVVSPGSVDAAERVLKSKLPLLLRRLYTEVGNGGYGPGGGLLGLTGGYPDSDGRTLPDVYEYFLREGWREGLLPLFDWGDGAWSAVDSRTPAATIVTADEAGITETRFGLTSWLSAWVEGIDLHAEIYEIVNATIINPFSQTSMTIKRRQPKKR